MTFYECGIGTFFEHGADVEGSWVVGVEGVERFKVIAATESPESMVRYMETTIIYDTVCKMFSFFFFNHKIQ